MRGLKNIMVSGGRCLIFPPYWVGGGTKAASPRDIFDQPHCQRSSVRINLAAHVGDYVVLSPGGTVLLISPGENRQFRGVEQLGRAGIRRFRPRGGHQNSPFRG